MEFVWTRLQRDIAQQIEKYDAVLVALEDAFNKYEAGRISINGYFETLCAIDEAVRRGRPFWLRLCDSSGALRGFNRTERRAFIGAIDALDWCRNWALRQRGVDMSTCDLLAQPAGRAPAR